MILHRFCKNSKTTGAPNGAGTVHPSGSPDFKVGVRVAQSVVFCALFCKSLFVLFLVAIVSVFLQ